MSALFIGRISRTEVSMAKRNSLRDLKRSLTKLRTVGSLDGDVMALVFIVLTQAARSAREDLKAVMATVKDANQRKARWRQIAECQQGLAAGVFADTCRVERKALKLIDALELLAIEDLEHNLDSLSEMGEMESLRLQMAMDRLSKMMSTLSNLLKKLSETAQGISQNIK